MKLVILVLLATMQVGPSLVAAHFMELAQKMSVAEMDFLTLKGMGIVNLSKFYYRTGDKEGLENFLRDNIFPYGTIEETNARTGEVTLRGFMRWRSGDYRDQGEWMTSDDAGALRKLWKIAKTESDKDLEQITEEPVEGVTQKRIGLTVMQHLNSTCDELGLRTTPFDRPGGLTLAMINGNHKPAVLPMHIPWEKFLSEDDEARAQRLNLNKKEAGIRLLPQKDTGTVKAMQATRELARSPVEDVQTMREVLKIRTHGYAMLQIVEQNIYQEYTDEYERALRRVVPDKMRVPTMNEVKLVDRFIHERIFEELSRRRGGSLQEGLVYFLDNKNHRFWKFIDEQPAEYPDQGHEASWVPKQGKGGAQLVPPCQDSLRMLAPVARTQPGLRATSVTTRQGCATSANCPGRPTRTIGSASGRRHRNPVMATLRSPRKERGRARRHHGCKAWQVGCRLRRTTR